MRLGMPRIIFKIVSILIMAVSTSQSNPLGPKELIQQADILLMSNAISTVSGAHSSLIFTTKCSEMRCDIQRGKYVIMSIGAEDLQKYTLVERDIRQSICGIQESATKKKSTNAKEIIKLDEGGGGEFGMEG